MPELSVVVPVCNEEDNVEPLINEIRSAFAGRDIEIIYVDDGSSDGTVAAIQRVRASGIPLRLLRHSIRRGQSAAIHTGISHATADWPSAQARRSSSVTGCSVATPGCVICSRGSPMGFGVACWGMARLTQAVASR
jgi:hypothetical protein